MLHTRHVLLLFLSFFLYACAHKSDTIDSLQHEHLKQLQSANYLQYLETRASLIRDFSSLCASAVAQGIKNAIACNDIDFLQTQSAANLDKLCALDVPNACFLYATKSHGTIRLTADSLQKACVLGHAEACANLGAITQGDGAKSWLQKACALDNVRGCKALYFALDSSDTQRQDIYYKLLDFGEDSVCEDDGCQIQGHFVQENTLQNACAKGSGMACVAVVRKMRQTPPRYMSEGQRILHKHCFVRHYVPACEELQDIYALQKNADSWFAAGKIACESMFFAQGVLGYEKSPHLCTRVADSIVIDTSSTRLDSPKKQAMLLYKIGCERGNEEKACTNLHELLTRVSLQSP
ncbi:MAG: hypothetical protein K2O85_01170 [Helicobacter sp.]|nr:hypothetical protein [Helicobacter sp.]